MHQTSAPVSLWTWYFTSPIEHSLPICINICTCVCECICMCNCFCICICICICKHHGHRPDVWLSLWTWYSTSPIEQSLHFEERPSFLLNSKDRLSIQLRADLERDVCVCLDKSQKASLTLTPTYFQQKSLMGKGLWDKTDIYFFGKNPNSVDISGISFATVVDLCSPNILFDYFCFWVYVHITNAFQLYAAPEKPLN